MWTKPWVIANNWINIFKNPTIKLCNLVSVLFLVFKYISIKVSILENQGLPDILKTCI